MNEIQQMTFNYNDLPAAAQIAARTAAERIKMRLRRTAEDIVEIGRELSEIKFQIGHGKFLPWIEAEFDMHENTARNFMKVAEKFKSTKIVDFKPSVLYQLSAPSTPDEVIEKATEKAESGEKVSVEDVKRWKAEAEQAKTQAKELQICAMQNQEKAEQLRESLEAAQMKIDELNQQEPQVKIQMVTKEIFPPDYEDIKESLELAKAEAEEAGHKLKDLKKKQEQEVSAGVQEAIRLHKNDLEAMERKRAQAEARLEELNAHIQLLGSKAETHKFHDKVIGDWEHELIELSLMVTEFRYIPETHDKWLRLAKNFKDAGQAIEMLIAEKSGRSLNDGEYSSDNHA